MPVDIEEPEMTLTDIRLEDDDGRKKSRATVLIEIGSLLPLFHCENDSAYAEIEVRGHVEVWPLETKSFRDWLSHQYFNLTNTGADRGALADALSTLSSKAKFNCEQRDVYLRVASLGDTIYMDMCDEAWRVIKINAEGWEILPQSPIAFIRHKGMAPLPVPDQDGDVNLLWQLLNMGEKHRPLVLGFFASAMRMYGPYPILVLLGEQGTAKSSVARVVRSLIDPSTVPLRAPPKDERDFMVSAMNNWLVVMDNLSGMQNWLADAMCRLSTGGGYSARELYSNTDEILRDVQRPSVVNGIDDVCTRGDFAHRALLLHLLPISKQDRITERQFNKRLAKHAPKIMGGLLDRLSTALRNIDSVNLKELPRMGDFLEWAVAAEGDENEFEAAYYQNQSDLVMTGLLSSPVSRTLMDMMGYPDNGGLKEWRGSMTDLLDALNDHMFDEDTRKSKAWPKAPNWLSNVIRRLGNSLREIGLDVHPPEQDPDHKMVIYNTRVTITQNGNIADIAKLLPEASLHSPGKLPELLDSSPDPVAKEQKEVISGSAENVSPAKKQKEQYFIIAEDAPVAKQQKEVIFKTAERTPFVPCPENSTFDVETPESLQ